MDYADLISGASQRFNLPPQLLASMIGAESSFNPRATGPYIPKYRSRAVGLAQVMPDTYAELRQKYGLGEDQYDPYNSITAGAAYYREMLDKYGDPRLAMIAYNYGPGNTDRWQRSGGNDALLPKSTRDYLARIDGETGLLGIQPSPNASPAMPMQSQQAPAPAPAPSPSGGSSMDFLNLLQSGPTGLLGGGASADPYAGLLSDEQLRQARAQGLMQAGAALLANGGYSTTPRTLGQGLGAALQAGLAGYQGGVDQSLQSELLGAKVGEMKRKAALGPALAAALGGQGGAGGASAITAGMSDQQKAALQAMLASGDTDQALSFISNIASQGNDQWDILSADQATAMGLPAQTYQTNRVTGEIKQLGSKNTYNTDWAFGVVNGVLSGTIDPASPEYYTAQMIIRSNPKAVVVPVDPNDPTKGTQTQFFDTDLSQLPPATFNPANLNAAQQTLIGGGGPISQTPLPPPAAPTTGTPAPMPAPTTGAPAPMPGGMVPTGPGVQTTTGMSADRAKKLQESNDTLMMLGVSVDALLADVDKNGMQTFAIGADGGYQSSNYIDLMMQLKTAQELGVLQGRDETLLKLQAADPTELSTLVRGLGGPQFFKAQMKALRDKIQRQVAYNRATLSGQDPVAAAKTVQGAPAAPAAEMIYNGRRIVPAPDNSGWIYKDTGEPAQ